MRGWSVAQGMLMDDDHITAEDATVALEGMRIAVGGDYRWRALLSVLHIIVGLLLEIRDSRPLPVARPDEPHLPKQ
jgi:hypothetical protein